jgi:hypothetical protein
MKCLLPSGVFCLYVCVRVGVFLCPYCSLCHHPAPFFLAEVLANGQQPHTNGITPFVFSPNIFNDEKGETGAHFYVLSAFI